MGAQQEAIIRKTVGGAAWAVLSSVGARIVGGAGTILLAYFMAPSVVGEVGTAYTIVSSAHVFSTLGIATYIAAKPNAGRDMVWHATVMHLGIGLVAILAILPIAPLLADYYAMPNLMAYVPGLVLVVLLERVFLLPERVLARQMRFRTIGLARTVGELTFTGLTLGLAALWNQLGGVPARIGMAIVYANIAQYAVMLTITAWAADRREWLTPSRLSLGKMREILQFGVPLSLAGISNFVARKYDNLIIAKVFGPGVVGAYDRAYNLADIPAVQIGEQIGDVLLPSFAQMTPEDRRKALVRSVGLLSLVVFPMAVGLGAISKTLVAAILPATWWQVAPLLALLSGFAVVRPLGWTHGSYLQASNQPRAVAIMGVVKATVLLGAVAGFSTISVYWACAGASLGFLAHALVGMLWVRRLDQVPISHLLWQSLQPLMACVPMVGAVLGIRWLWDNASLGLPGIAVVVETAVGGAVYFVSALLFAPRISRDLLNLVRDQIKKRRGR